MFTIDWNPPPRVLRNFGVTGMVVCVVLAILAGGRGRLLAWTLPPQVALSAMALLLVGAAVLGLASWQRPQVLWPLYRVLSVVGLPIGATIAALVMGATFYLVVTPIGLVQRTLGRDPMTRCFDDQASSYWQERRPATDVSRYFRQY